MHKLSKKQIIVLALVTTIIGSIVYYIYSKQNENVINDEEILVKEDIIDNNPKEKEVADKQNIFIHVSGAVNKEGVIEISSNSRVKDAIEKVGGLKENADLTNINLASLLEDGAKIYIPVKGENIIENNNLDSNINQNINNIQNKTLVVNINIASQNDLEKLPGIGPSTALKIINYRKENGKFSSIEDIKKVSGIGDSKFNSIKDLIKVK